MRPRRLDIDGLRTLSVERQKNLLRLALGELGLSLPSTQLLERVINEVIPARIDAQPVVSWPGASVRRYRNALYLLPEKLTPGVDGVPLSRVELPLGPGLGRLQLLEGAETGLSAELVHAGVTVNRRKGGEEIKPYGQAHTRKLKKLLQEEGVVPWMRDRLPLLYAGDRLVAVADLWLADEAVTKPGLALRWIDRPALH
jgi:tRNA(Ile)-lysidine synthase